MSYIYINALVQCVYLDYLRKQCVYLDYLREL